MTPAEIREAASNSLGVFIRLVSPHLALSQCHMTLIDWWTSSMRKDNVLVLYPRAHLKSQLMAHKACWELVKDPTATILYVSATSDLAEQQLYLIKNILTSKVFRKYWPEMVKLEDAKRERWNSNEIIVDHPKRAIMGIRDPSVKAAGLTTNITGFHATHIMLDDIVVPKNAYTEEGRQSVASQVSQIASIREPGSRMDCVGTRYHGKDQYSVFLEQTYTEYDDDGNPKDEHPLWDCSSQVVEVDGEYLWPRERNIDGKWYGFNANVLSKIKAAYSKDMTQYFAQYYQNPNMGSNGRLTREKFQYFSREALKIIEGRWHIHGKRLNVFAAMDFAFSLKRAADYTALVVVGVSADNHYYVLDIVRFKSDRISDYFEAILKAYQKWNFKVVRCEVSAAQQAIVTDLKQSYIVANNLPLSVDEYRPMKGDGAKEERIRATLEPKYDNQQIWHFLGGATAELEEELLSAKPKHDDLKDALTAAIDVSVPPMKSKETNTANNIVWNSRFGGVAFR
jgi:Terminase RNaseH-like domain